MFKRNYYLRGLMIFCVVSIGVAEAKTATMQWFLQPNKTMGKTVSAKSGFFSAKCVTDIQSGELMLSINGQSRTLTPTKNSVTFSKVIGKSNGQSYTYAYSIRWLPSSAQANPANLVCQGDNHRND